MVGLMAALGEAGQDGSIVGCRQGSYPCSREGWARDAWQSELVVNSCGRDDLSRGHGGHALEGFVLHCLVLLTAVTKGLALTQKGGGGACCRGGNNQAQNNTLKAPLTSLTTVNHTQVNRRCIYIAILSVGFLKGMRQTMNSNIQWLAVVCT